MTEEVRQVREGSQQSANYQTNYRFGELEFGPDGKPWELVRNTSGRGLAYVR